MSSKLPLNPSAPTSMNTMRVPRSAMPTFDGGHAQNPAGSVEDHAASPNPDASAANQVSAMSALGDGQKSAFARLGKRAFMSALGNGLDTVGQGISDGAGAVADAGQAGWNKFHGAFSNLGARAARSEHGAPAFDAMRQFTGDTMHGAADALPAAQHDAVSDYATNQLQIDPPVQQAPAGVPGPDGQYDVAGAPRAQPAPQAAQIAHNQGPHQLDPLTAGQATGQPGPAPQTYEPDEQYLSRVMGSYDPNSPLDRRKADRIRELFQQNQGQLSPNQVYADQAYSGI